MLLCSNNNISFQAGILSSLALLFKHGKRDDMKIYGAPILNKILECGFKDSGSSVVRKMALKLTQRIGKYKRIVYLFMYVLIFLFVLFHILSFLFFINITS